ncbi:MAG: indolepyruvate ferredoxin oxidoreductase family protein [Actinomycetota bacterium]|nr:indolepyruvate ferredoxin oxidoreductase family protein [Actinomycetota bacterium]
MTLTTRRFAPLPGEREAEEGDSVFLTGIQALVRVVLDAMRRDRAAGLRTAAFVSGYPGSPLAGFDKEMARHRSLLGELDVVHLPGQNEELAATAVAGSQLVQGFQNARVDGVLGAWYGKAPGLCRALDAMWHGQFTGASSHGGVLLFVGDDPVPKSSMVPSASEHLLAALDVPVLFPGTVQEILSLGAHGVELSRSSGLWTALKIVASVADGFGSIPASALRATGNEPRDAGVPSLAKVRPPCVPESLETEQEIATLRREAAARYGRIAGLNRVTVDPPDAWLGIVAAGSLYRELISAMELLDLDEAGLRRFGVRLMQVQMFHPLEPHAFRAFGRGLREILVVEEKQPLLEPYLRDALYGVPDPPTIVGRRDEHGAPLLPGFGVLTSDRLARVVAARLAQRVPGVVLPSPDRQRPKIPVATTQRTPFFCSGCPHNSSLRVPEGTLVGVGTGCHALGAWADEHMVGDIVTKAQMGGEGATWLGLEPFVEADHLVQNMGDGTYFHSGQLAVQAAVAAGSHVTFKLLFNGAIAMTGGQDPAESDSRPVEDVAEILLRQGVSRVLVTTDDPARYRRVRLPRGVEVWDRGRVLEAQRVLAGVPGVTVLIHDQRCAAEKRRDRTRGRLPAPTRRVHINERVCEGCGDCSAVSNCLSVEPVDTELGRKTTIDQSSCNADYSCLRGNCPSFVIVDSRPSSLVRRLLGHARRPWNPADGPREQGTGVGSPPGAFPQPPQAVSPEDCVIRMPGIGGTGVVTVSQIIGTAATRAGRHVHGLDQTGLSQKAGPVVSELRVSAKAVDGSNQATRGGVDLFLGFDQVVSLQSPNLETIEPGRTIAVVSTSQTPTGDMVSHPERSLPSPTQVEEVLTALVGAPRCVLVDSVALAEGLLGSALYANVLLLGVAYQVGAIPLPADAVEAAIELNGVAVAQNLAAFRWGRAWVSDRPRVDEALAARREPHETEGSSRSAVELPDPIRRTSELRHLVELRARDLVEYQSPQYARHYVEVVEIALEAEERVAPGSSAFASSVARSLYKLMAYKDEYEVARLHLASVPEEARRRGVRVSWLLQPPVLTSIGLTRKVEVGPWFRPVFSALRAARVLRGGPLDPFAHTDVRKAERRLVKEFDTDIRRVAAIMSSENHALASEFAALADIVRGYEEVKMRNVATYDSRRVELLRALGLDEGAVRSQFE